MSVTLVRSFGYGRLLAVLRRPLCTVGKFVADVGERKPLRVTLVEGQGTGPEICAAVRKILEAAGVPMLWDQRDIRVHKVQSTGMMCVNEDLLESARETGRVLRGPELDSSSDGSHGSVVLALNKALKTSVGIRLYASVKGHEPYGTINVVNVRDNVSGLYSEIEHMAVPGNYQGRAYAGLQAFFSIFCLSAKTYTYVPLPFKLIFREGFENIIDKFIEIL